MNVVIRLSCSFALTVATISSGWQSALASQPPESLKPGIQSYNSRRYSQAINQLRAITGSEADNPFTHYYLALSYQGLGQYAQAEKEYRWNYDRGTDKDLRYKSWQGLLGLANARTSRSGAASTTTTSSPSTSSTGSDGVGGSNIASASSSGNSGGSNAPAPGSRQGKYILDGSTRSHVSNPFQMEWIPGCPRHR